SDVIRAQIDLQQRQRDLQETQLTIEKAKIALGVLIFPNFSSEFSVVDDLQQATLVPPMAEVQSQAAASSPDLAVAKASIGAAGYDISVARYAYLPSLALDFFYGINANQLAFRTQHPAADPELAYRQNLGYSAQATLNIPIWNWGATRSKIKQAEIRRDQAQLDLTLAQRTLQSNVASAQAEATLAQAQLDSLRTSVDLAVESFRLTVLRYQAGEATAFEVVDSQNTVNFARNAYDDGLARYRIAHANLQILTGTL
ncbi:MAG: TolC family protein, partial [Acidobacteriota bacterium]